MAPKCRLGRTFPSIQPGGCRVDSDGDSDLDEDENEEVDEDEYEDVGFDTPVSHHPARAPYNTDPIPKTLSDVYPGTPQQQTPETPLGWTPSGIPARASLDMNVSTPEIDTPSPVSPDVPAPLLNPETDSDKRSAASPVRLAYDKFSPYKRNRRGAPRRNYLKDHTLGYTPPVAKRIAIPTGGPSAMRGHDHDGDHTATREDEYLDDRVIIRYIDELYGREFIDEQMRQAGVSFDRNNYGKDYNGEDVKKVLDGLRHRLTPKSRKSRI